MVRWERGMRRDVIVIGASAGGIEALRDLVAAFPADLPAAVFVVQHIPPWSASELPAILQAAGPLPALHPKSEEKLERGRIYVAPPDQHLILDGDERVRLWHGPKENRFRPAINPLFRSAAVMYGPRVTGVVLSGMLDDGAAGLWWVKRFGGVAAVQDPQDATFADMPKNALAHAPVDYVLPVSLLGGALASVAAGRMNPATTREGGRP
jgi:two-component system, chemotaxis family, protein-glutamate methylesterase/glutaminase